MKSIIVLTLFFLSSFTFAAGKRGQLLDLVNQELSEVKRLNTQTKARNPNLLLRIAELYLQKARIYKEIENDKFLSYDFKTRQKIDKKRMFKKSNSYFAQAQKTCLYILKKFKRFKGRGDVFYILAFNAKEFQSEKRAMKYFRLSIKYSKKNSTTNRKAKLALAEMYYNQRSYKKALSLYEYALSSRSSKWWTKDAYNQAWCYFRINKKSKAIALMQEILKLSNKSKYYDMSKEVKRDLAFFYTDAGRVTDAINFYKKSGGNISSNLIKVSKLLLDQGKLSSAEKVLSEALNYNLSDKEDTEARNTLLQVYEKFGKYNKHYNIAETLFHKYEKGALPEEIFINLKYNIKKIAATLQKQVAGKQYKKRRKVRLSKAGLAVKYFLLEAKLVKDQSEVSFFHAAETYYAVGNYNQAIELYEKARVNARKNKNFKIQKLALSSMMASLGKKGVSKVNLQKFLIPIYKAFLSQTPKGKKSYIVYKSLFNAQMKKSDIQDAEKTLMSFKEYFPRDIKIQEAMLAEIMNYHKKKNNIDAVKQWVQRINNSEFKVTRKYAEQVKAYLLTVQFDKVEKASSSGDKLRALKGYVSIYKKTDSSVDAKKNAAYNIAVLFHELGDAQRGYKWIKQSLNLMNARDLLKFEQSFLTIINGVFNSRLLKESAELYRIFLNKTCRKNFKNKELFVKNINVILLAEGLPKKSEEVIQQGRRCMLSDGFLNQQYYELVKYYSEVDRFEDMKRIINKISLKDKVSPSLIEYDYSYYKYLVSVKNYKAARKVRLKIIKNYNSFLSRKREIPVESLDAVALLKMRELTNISKKIKSIKLSFPEKKYNNLLKKKFKMLDDLTSVGVSILQVRSGKGIVKAYKILVEEYRDFASSIKNFSPSGKPKEYIKSFQASMSELVKPIDLKANDFFNEAIRSIVNNNILSDDNFWFMQRDSENQLIRFFPLRNSFLMDRVGK